MTKTNVPALDEMLGNMLKDIQAGLSEEDILQKQGCTLEQATQIIDVLDSAIGEDLATASTRRVVALACLASMAQTKRQKVISTAVALPGLATSITLLALGIPPEVALLPFIITGVPVIGWNMKKNNPAALKELGKRIGGVFSRLNPFKKKETEAINLQPQES